MIRNGHTRRKNKRQRDSDDEQETPTTSEVLLELADTGQTPTSRDVARARWNNVAAVLLATDVPSRILNHYLHKAAIEMELALRNRESATIGAVYADIHIPMELDVEIERRLDRYMSVREQLEQTPEAEKEEVEIECTELLCTLKVYQAMSSLLSCNGSPQYAAIRESAQALFFCLVHMSRELQAMIFLHKHRWRLPEHVGITDRSAIGRLMEVLQLLTPLYTSGVLKAHEYVDKLRKFVFWGSLEIDDLEWGEQGADNEAETYYENGDDEDFEESSSPPEHDTQQNESTTPDEDMQ